MGEHRRINRKFLYQWIRDSSRNIPYNEALVDHIEELW